MDITAFSLGDEPLRITRLAALARNVATTLSFSTAARQRITQASDFLLARCAAGEEIYGVTTGLGAAVDTPVKAQDAALTPHFLQRRIPLGRAVGIGPLAHREQVRAMMIARLAGVAVGRSGMSLSTAQGVLTLLNTGIHPSVPLIGSLSEADLAPLAHIAQALTGEGEVEYQGITRDAATLFSELKIVLPQLSGKDGLALVSSNAACTGMAALLLDDIARVFSAQIGAIALSFEGFIANVSPLSPLAARLRPAAGQQQAAALLSDLLQGSYIMTEGHARRLQDPLSFRNIAVLLGTVQQAFLAACEATELELNSSDDNPAIIVEEQRILANANFDATHLTLALEHLGLALARLTVAGGERLMKLMSPSVSGLPRFLAAQPGSAGFGPLQKTIASLVSDIQRHAQPLTAMTLPVADRIEDYAAQTMAVVQKLGPLLESWRWLVAIELLVSAQAIDLRDPHPLGRGSEEIYRQVRRQAALLDEERSLTGDIQRLAELIDRRDLVPQVRTLLEMT